MNQQKKLAQPQKGPGHKTKSWIRLCASAFSVCALALVSDFATSAPSGHSSNEKAKRTCSAVFTSAQRLIINRTTKSNALDRIANYSIRHAFGNQLTTSWSVNGIPKEAVEIQGEVSLNPQETVFHAPGHFYEVVTGPTGQWVTLRTLGQGESSDRIGFSQQRRLSPLDLAALGQTPKPDQVGRSLYLPKDTESSLESDQALSRIDQARSDWRTSAHVNGYLTPHNHDLRLHLSNAGAERYLWYWDEELQSPQAGRVLDLHLHAHESSKFSVLIETIVEGHRIVKQLSLTEVLSIEDFTRKFGRIHAAKEFFESLSVLEVELLVAAKKLGLRTFGFVDLQRDSNGHKSRWFNQSAYHRSHAQGHVRVQTYLNEVWGRSGRGLKENVFDEFANLSPSEVIQEYAPAPDRKQGYIFVITEDARAKLIPIDHTDDKLVHFHPSYLRLASLRQVFAAGFMLLDTQGKATLTLESWDYESRLKEWVLTGGSAFSNENPNLDVFLTIFFKRALNIQVTGVHALDVETWWERTAEEVGPVSRDRNLSTGGQSGGTRSNKDPLFDFLNDLESAEPDLSTDFKGAGADFRTRASSDTEDRLHLQTLEEYVRSTRGTSNLSEREIKLSWALSFFGAHRNEPIQEIRSRSRIMFPVEWMAAKSESKEHRKYQNMIQARNILRDFQRGALEKAGLN